MFAHSSTASVGLLPRQCPSGRTSTSFAPGSTRLSLKLRLCTSEPMGTKGASTNARSPTSPRAIGCTGPWVRPFLRLRLSIDAVLTTLMRQERRQALCQRDAGCHGTQPRRLGTERLVAASRGLSLLPRFPLTSAFGPFRFAIGSIEGSGCSPPPRAHQRESIPDVDGKDF